MVKNETKMEFKNKQTNKIFVYLRDLGRLKNETPHPVHD